jgi:hypothetical protein
MVKYEQVKQRDDGAFVGVVVYLGGRRLPFYAAKGSHAWDDVFNQTKER